MSRARETFFPDSEYAHRPFCGSHDGMALISERERQFVQCVCGARGQAVERSSFVSNGRVDVAAMDAATRRAWNIRAGSDGTFELEAKLLDAVQRMSYFASVSDRSPHAFMQEIQMWAAHLNNAQASSASGR